MAIQTKIEKIDGVDLKKFWSDRYVKIQCNEDMNIYQVVYTTLSSKSTFFETNIPIEDYKIQAKDVTGLSTYIDTQTEDLRDATAENSLCIINIVENGVQVDDKDLSVKVIRIIDSIDGKLDNVITIDPGGS